MPQFEGELFPLTPRWETKYYYKINHHFHPFVENLIEISNRGRLQDLLNADLSIESEDYFTTVYDPNPDRISEIVVEEPYPQNEIELETGRAYSIYNWELFFHIPITIAVQLSSNQRFADAQKWFHYIFDPTTDTPPSGEDPHDMSRYWKFKYFYDNGNLGSIQEMLEALSSESDAQEIKDLKDKVSISIDEWKDNPFSPHALAQTRPLAYKYNVVMRYLDNLIDWGDSLFRQFTMESINEATQIYLLASSILGERPQKVPKLRKRPIRTYKQIKENLSEFGNVLVEMENEFPLNSNIPSGSPTTSPMSDSLLGIGKQLYFCIPHNQQLMEYWDKVEDRMTKIRSCMDIDGNVRPLPLFQPAIDPGMLVKGAAAGIDLSSLVAGLSQSVSNVRFRVIYEKASEMTCKLIDMGRDYLEVIEKGDAQKLALLHHENEIQMNRLTKDIKFLRWKEAEETTEALFKARDSVIARLKYYQKSLGDSGATSGLSDVELTRPSITEDNFETVHGELVDNFKKTVEKEDYQEGFPGVIGGIAYGVGYAFSFLSTALELGQTDHLKLKPQEEGSLNFFMPMSAGFSIASMATEKAGTIIALIPQVKVLSSPLGVGASVGFGAKQLTESSKALSKVFKGIAKYSEYAAKRTEKMGYYERRRDKWVTESNALAKDVQDLGRQIIASLINEQALKKEFENHTIKSEQAEAIKEYLENGKFTNEELFLWMQGELSRVYYDFYKLAHDTAKKAEATMKHELKREDVNDRDFISFNYWDSGRKGLLSGESLLLDLKKMEVAYCEKNIREFEITKDVSLKRLNPMALLQLKTAGFCEFDIPEWFYDLSSPGHYMRRIKSVSVSIPCTKGTNISVNCTLSLHKSTIRVSPLVSGGYGREEEDLRFEDRYGAIQSVVTSTAENDSGMFEVDLNEDRFLPFEGSGAESSWRLSLPAGLREFDYNTISDAVIHVKYTARQGGELMATEAANYIKNEVMDVSVVNGGSAHLFNLSEDFPTEWQNFQNGGDLTITVSKDQLPYIASTQNITVDTAETKLFDVTGENLVSINSSAFVTLNSDFGPADPNTMDITIERSAIINGNNVVLLLAYDWNV